jgi:hypothetical protein
MPRVDRIRIGSAGECFFTTGRLTADIGPIHLRIRADNRGYRYRGGKAYFPTRCGKSFSFSRQIQSIKSEFRTRDWLSFTVHGLV